MELTLAVLRCPDNAVPETRRVRGDFSIGRAPGNDWVLSDPDRVLSKHHCVLEFRSGGWQVRDLSTNGTYLNQATAPVGREAAAPLNDGDRLRLGAWEVEVRVSAGAAQAAPLPWGGTDPFAEPPAAAYHPPASTAALDPLFDPMAPPPPAYTPFGQPTTSRDPFGEDEAPMPDHRPSASDAFRPPPSRPASVLPDDWDLDLSPAPAPQPSAPPPPPRPVPPPQQEAPLPLSPAEPDSFSVAQPWSPQPAEAAPHAAKVTESGIAAFLAGAGLPPHVLAATDPDAALHAAGVVTRAAIAGMRALLIARADVKREFRIEQTMLRASGNNPVKFAASNEAALLALLTMPGQAALEETVADLAAHQAATLAATQAAARALLQRLAPAPLEAADTGGGLMPGAREKRLWEAYKTLHQQTAEQFDDDFDSAFGKAFARAYEDAIRGGRG